MIRAKIEDDEIEKLILTASEYRRIEKLNEKFKDLNSVTLALQKENTTVADARCLFETVLEEFPEMRKRLGNDAKIIANPNFENAICKLMNQEYDNLSVIEKSTVKDLIQSNSDDCVPVDIDDNSLSLGERALKKRKISCEKSVYMDLRFIQPTSNMCERLFSVAGFALNDRRKCILPMNFERQIFLHANSEFWKISDINELANKS